MDPLPLPAHLDRRGWLRLAGGAVLLGQAGCSAGRSRPARRGPPDAPLRFPGKVPMRAINSRPPCLETPWEYFRHDLTPNEAFYVRWHLQMIPTRVDSALAAPGRRQRGQAARAVSSTSCGRCPHPPSWRSTSARATREACSRLPCPGPSGATGPGQRAVDGRPPGRRLRPGRAEQRHRRGQLCRHGPRRDARGARLRQSLPITEARRGDLLLAYAMNGEPLPLLNGFPLRPSSPAGTPPTGSRPSTPSPPDEAFRGLR